ncbi:MAG TPA: DJ-1/PfpI family protein, partial [Candidatus Wallbacteria bacterium]|nr:DJ-1/PfpI family protein [Candidatus Wallbacteria bacterium]
LIKPDEIIDNINFQAGDLLILPGAETWQDGNNHKIMEIVSRLIGEKVIIAAICGATIALAENGLLNNRKHTSNDLGFLKMVCPNYSGSDYYINEPAVSDDNLITATGLAPLEFAYEILKKTGVMRKDTLNAWYGLFKTKEAKYFQQMMDSLK